MSDAINEEAAREISTADQDARWPAPKLIGLGAVTLAIALVVIYVISGLGGH